MYITILYACSYSKYCFVTIIQILKKIIAGYTTPLNYLHYENDTTLYNITIYTFYVNVTRHY